jgi:hypothetical protein
MEAEDDQPSAPGGADEPRLARFHQERRAGHLGNRSPLGINGAAKHLPQELVVISQILGKLGSHIALFVPER